MFAIQVMCLGAPHHACIIKIGGGTSFCVHLEQDAVKAHHAMPSRTKHHDLASKRLLQLPASMLMSDHVARSQAGRSNMSADTLTCCGGRNFEFCKFLVCGTSHMVSCLGDGINVLLAMSSSLRCNRKRGFSCPCSRACMCGACNSRTHTCMCGGGGCITCG